MKSLRQEPLFCQVLAKSGDHTRVFTSGDVFCGKGSLSKIKNRVIGARYRRFTKAILRKQRGGG